jgi:hypothetical protein
MSSEVVVMDNVKYDWTYQLLLASEYEKFDTSSVSRILALNIPKTNKAI